MKKKTNEPYAVRLSSEVIAAIEGEAKRSGTTRSHVLRESVKTGLPLVVAAFTGKGAK